MSRARAGHRPSHGACAVVTGAARGIGRAFAEAVVERGGRVVVADLDLAEAERTAAALGAHRGVARAVRCDVASAADVDRLRDEACAFFGGDADLVVLNAGVGAGGQTVEDTPLDDVRHVVDVNLWGVIHGCRAFVPGLRRRGRGGLLTVASAASFMAVPHMSTYNATKAAVVALTETLAGELADTDVHVSVLCPGLVRTDILRSSRLPPTAFEAAQRLMDALGAPPERIAREALDALDAGRLHGMPQLDVRLTALAKRALPGGFVRGMGRLGRISPLHVRSRPPRP